MRRKLTLPRGKLTSWVEVWVQKTVTMCDESLLAHLT
jgi:hypothetical protein